LFFRKSAASARATDQLVLCVLRWCCLHRITPPTTTQEVEAVASRLFQLSQARLSSADAASLSSLVSSCKELRLYSENLLSAALARAKVLLQAQLQGGPGLSAGFSARQLGVVLHSLAVLGLKPSDGWLRLAVMTAGGWLQRVVLCARCAW
jgi:hypothetical protein